MFFATSNLSSKSRILDNAWGQGKQTDDTPFWLLSYHLSNLSLQSSMELWHI